MSFAVALLVGFWAFATFAIAAAGGLFRGRERARERARGLPETRHRRTEIAVTDGLEPQAGEPG